MSEYRRAFQPGGMFFFTLVTHGRRRFLCDPLGRTCLRDALRLAQVEAPFEIVSIVLLPDHLHCLWQLPRGDSDFSTRWGKIKRCFTKNWLRGGGHEGAIVQSRVRHRERGVWQRRFWEHAIRDEDDYARHMDYIHYNPVKHGLVSCPHQWPHSSFHRWVNDRVYAVDWQCGCGERRPIPPDFSMIDETAIE